MSDGHWVESLYETFIIRDLIGYAGSGSILTIGVLCELEKVQFLKSIISTWPGFALLVVWSYIIATGLRLLGTHLYLVVFHRPRGFFGRARITDTGPDCRTKIENILWRGDEAWLTKVYKQINSRKRDSVISREDLFIHLTGLTGMALFVLGFAVLFFCQNGLEKRLGIPDLNIVIIIFFASIVFLLGHYRHAHQEEVLNTLPKNG